MDKRKKSVQFSVEVYDERDSHCGIPLCPVTVFSDLRFLIPLSLALIFVQGLVSYQQQEHQEDNHHDIGQNIGVVLTAVFFSYFGRNHKPRCLGIAAILTAVSSFLLGFQRTAMRGSEEHRSDVMDNNVTVELESHLWLLGPASQFLNGVGLLITVSLGTSYFDNNFPGHFPVILGVGGAVKTAASLVSVTRPAVWMACGSLIALASLPIALLPKVINRVATNYGVTVTPTDDPSVLPELRNSISAVVRNELVIYNCFASVFFSLGLNLICNERMGIGIQALGFLLSGWFIQFVKPRGRILAGVNICVGLGFLIHTVTHTFYCRCDFLNFVIFSTLLFLSCFGRIGAFLFTARSDVPL